MLQTAIDAMHRILTIYAPDVSKLDAEIYARIVIGKYCDNENNALEAENERLRQIISLGEDQVFALQQDIKELRRRKKGRGTTII